MKEISAKELEKIESEIEKKEYIIIEIDKAHKDGDTVYTRRKYSAEGEKEAVRKFEIERQTEMGLKQEEIHEVAKRCVEAIRKTVVEKVWFYEAGDCVMYVIEV